jgi:excisionase family DNA binding protein
MAEDVLLTPAQVAARLQVTERTVCDWLKNGGLRGVKLGRIWRVSPSALEALVSGERAIDDDDSLSPEEAVASEAAWQAHLDGHDPGEALEDVIRQLSVSQRA